MRNIKKISSQLKIRKEDIENIKEEILKGKIGDVARRYGFTNMPVFNSKFRNYVGCTPKEYKGNSSMRERYDHEELSKFFSGVDKIDPFVFYLGISNHKFFGFLTRNEDYFIKLKNAINKDITNLSISLHSLTIDRNGYMGSLYSVLDKEAFFENYILNLDGKEIPCKDLPIKYKSKIYEKGSINHVKTLLEDILDVNKA